MLGKKRCERLKQGQLGGTESAQISEEYSWKDLTHRYLRFIRGISMKVCRHLKMQRKNVFSLS